MADKPRKKISFKLPTPEAAPPKPEPVPDSFESLVAEVEKAAETSVDTSTFEKFIKKEEPAPAPAAKEAKAEKPEPVDDDDDDLGDLGLDDDDGDAGDSSDAGDDDDDGTPARTAADTKNIRLIRNYRHEFGSVVMAPDEEELSMMSSKELAAEVERIRNDVSGGISVDQVRGIYFTAVAMVEQTGPSYGAELYGLTAILKQNTTVDTCLRAATCEIKAQITNALPWWAMLPATTAIACVQVHAMNKAERGTMEYFNRPVNEQAGQESGVSAAPL